MDFTKFERMNKTRFKKMTLTGRRQRRLVIDPVFKSLLSRIADPQTLENNFTAIHFFDEKLNLNTDDTYAFIIPPQITTVDKIAKLRAEVDSKKFTPFLELWFQPRINDAVAAFMIEKNIAPENLVTTFPTPGAPATKDSKVVPNPNLETYNLDIDLVALDIDVLTTNSPYAFLRAYSYNDLTVVSEIRKAIGDIYNYTGFLSIYSIGDIATAVSKMLPPPTDSNSLNLIIIDRKADLMTPLITQMNYEGLIADFLGIDCGTVEVQTDKGKQLQLLSSLSDKLFSQICYMNHQEVSGEIERRMNQVSGAFNKQESASFEEGVAQFKKTAQISLENQTLIDHINLASSLFTAMRNSRFFKPIMNTEADILQGVYSKNRELVSEMMEWGGEMQPIVRLLALESLIKGGIKGDDYVKLCQQIYFNYGLQMLPYLTRLSDVGLLNQSSKNAASYSSIVKNFNLFDPEWEQNDDNACASYLGYAPFSVRMVQKIAEGDFKSVNKAINELGQNCLATTIREDFVPEGDFLIVFIGGCTHSELNTFRRINRIGYNKYKILTTDMISSNDFLNRLAEGIPAFNTSCKS